MVARRLDGGARTDRFRAATLSARPRPPPLLLLPLLASHSTCALMLQPISSSALLATGTRSSHPDRGTLRSALAASSSLTPHGLPQPSQHAELAQSLSDSPVLLPLERAWPFDRTTASTASSCPAHARARAAPPPPALQLCARPKCTAPCCTDRRRRTSRTCSVWAADCEAHDLLLARSYALTLALALALARPCAGEDNTRLDISAPDKPPTPRPSLYKPLSPPLPTPLTGASGTAPGTTGPAA